MLDKKLVIKLLKKCKIGIKEIPDELQNDLEVIFVERMYGYRKIKSCGYDVIADEFFVVESIANIVGAELVNEKEVCTTFSLFNDYYIFLDKQIYDCACYSYLPKYRMNEMQQVSTIDKERLFRKDCLIDYTISDFDYTIEDEKGDRREKIKLIQSKREECFQWIKKFSKCKDIDKMLSIRRAIEVHDMDIVTYNRFDIFLWIYLQESYADAKKKKVIFNYLNQREYPGRIHNYCLDLIIQYGLDEVLSYYRPMGVASNIAKYKKKFKDFNRALYNGELEVFHEYGVDSNTYFYYDKSIYKIDEIKVGESYRYFKNFEAFAKYRNRDLRNCDLSTDYTLTVDCNEYTIDDTTVLPPEISNKLNRVTKKYYQQSKFGNRFCIDMEWTNEYGRIVHTERFRFKYFFDFVHFLEGKLAEADLLMCEELLNIESVYKIDLAGALISSKVCDKFSVNYEKVVYDTKYLDSFAIPEQYEKETGVVLGEQHDIEELYGYQANINRISYITDLHLMHRFMNAKIKSTNDAIVILRRLVSSIVHTSESIVLIGGDVATDFNLFTEFVKLLHEMNPYKKYIFVLGNHELWYHQASLGEIVEKYRKLLSSYDMYLLQNEVMYMEEDKIKIVSYKQLQSIDEMELRNITKYSRLTILGGIGFAGYNDKFNADNGVYGETITRYQERQETEKFREIYEIVENSLYDKPVIVFTHMPKDDWSNNANYHNKFVYVSGHSHRNEFYDDGSTRVYADNQIGYHGNIIRMKSFIVDASYDVFSDYSDGIYEITSQQYHDFYRGKNIHLTFSREVHILYMVKKNGVYAFFHMTKSGSLTILNGGEKRKLRCRDIKYYYDNMDIVINYINKPLKKYTEYQEKVSGEIKRIGGSGYIHGCIVDIDFYNHVYVNPNDGSIVPYMAYTMVEKYVYKNIPSLLKKECPMLYAKYLNLIEEKKIDSTCAIKPISELNIKPTVYMNTDIYRVSREISRMQKIENGILGVWFDDLGTNLIE